jgi:hypothetical protein
MKELRIRFSNQEEHGVGYGSSIPMMLTPLRALSGYWQYVIESHGPYGWTQLTQGSLSNP